MLISQSDQFSGELKKLILLVVTFPVEPTDFVVLAVSVVVAVLTPAPLVSAAQHRHALGKKQSGKKIPALPVAQGIDLRIVGGPFHAAVPRLIIVVAVAVIVAIQVVVVLVVADQISQREPVMCCDEVNARIRPAAVMFIEVGAPGQSIGHFANAALVALPKTANRVTIFSIPFGPVDRKIANLVTPIADVPRLCD